MVGDALGACERRRRLPAELGRLARQQDLGTPAHGVAQSLGILALGRGLGLDDVVRAGRRLEGGDDGGRGVIGMDHRLVGVGIADDCADTPSRRRHLVGGVRGVGSAEHAEPQHDSGIAGSSEASGGGFGGRDRFECGTGVDRRVLVDPRIPAVGIGEGDRLLDVPAGAGGQGGVDELGGALGPDAVVLVPGAGEGGLSERGDVGRQVDHDVMAGHGGSQRVRVEERDLDRIGTDGAQEVGLLGPAGDRGHLVPGGHQPLHGPPPDHPGPTGDEDLHRTTSCIHADDLRMATGDAAPATSTTRSRTDTAASSWRQAASAARMTLVIVHGAR